jgi:hypothetical protein
MAPAQQKRAANSTNSQQQPEDVRGAKCQTANWNWQLRTQWRKLINGAAESKQARRAWAPLAQIQELGNEQRS